MKNGKQSLQNREINHLKYGVLLLIANQDELNMLAEVVEVIEMNSLHITEPYVAFMEEVLCVMPQSQIDESHQHYRSKPRKMKSWRISMKNKT